MKIRNAHNLILLTTLLGLVLFMIAQPHLGCRGPNSGLPTTKMKIGDRTFTLEVATSESERQTGLMNRDSMAEDRGMLFVFEEETGLGFWMKNTRIPLDLIYLDAKGQIVSIHHMKPYDESTVYSQGPAKYVVELNAGMARKAGVKPGDRLSLPGL